MIAALTGSIGCGKSTVLEIFSRMEWFTLSADRICHDIYNSGDLEFNAAIAERWGSGYHQRRRNCRQKEDFRDCVQ